MKLILIIWSLVLALSAFAQSPVTVTAPVDHLFIPRGFDNNDNIEVVVTGKYPNPCYSRNISSVEVKEDKIYVTVTALRRGDDSGCEPMSVPFSESVTIGNLQAGDYDIIVNGSTRFEQKGSLHIGISRSTGVDEHLYAIVDYVELGFTGGLSGSAFLMVRAPSDCVVFDRVEYLSNGQDTLSVLPIMKRISSHCREEVRRFEIPIKFDPANFTHNDILLFVRSIEGKSVHSIINR